MALQWRPVNSSMISRAGYDFETEEMQLQFSNGRVYTYASVPVSVFNGLLDASSPGSYYHANIKGQYDA